MRKLVTIRTITDILPIEGADKIEQVCIDGWVVVSQKGIHSKGDDVLFFEIDSFLPSTDCRYESFMKFGTRTFEDVLGHRVKTVRLRWVYSQGIIMPLAEFPEIRMCPNADIEVDYAELLGIKKWEAPESFGKAGKLGDSKGNFPWFLRKSDQERIQNLYGKLVAQRSDRKFVGTLKMDGSSVTVYCVEGERYNAEQPLVGICSRNLEVKYDPELPDDQQGRFVQGALYSGLFYKVKLLNELYGGSWAIQGELVGEGIQKTFEKFTEYQVFAYNIFDIVRQEYVDYITFRTMAKEIGLVTVPVIYEEQRILEKDLPTILSMADGKGLLADYREGIVWKQLYGTTQFKVISNKYLSKEE